ncbi:HNH endonuclease [Ruminococcaceae bacterium OttesenSCG-928-I18]|nr:HNH endonuclease [Ruminococcaceae bacterium OttesenSCG-928-I18]
MSSINHICERCAERNVLEHADTAHHRVHLSPENISDPEVTLNWENLMGVCRECHAEVHGKTERRIRYDEGGRVIKM